MQVASPRSDPVLVRGDLCPEILTVHRKTIEILLFCPEKYPTTRVDVEVLFGHEMAGRRGHRIVAVMQAADVGIGAGLYDWHGGVVRVGSTNCGPGMRHRAARYLMALWHDVANLFRVRSGEFDVIQVRDKFLVAVLALLWAKWRGVKFFYWLSFPFPEARLARARNRQATHPVLTAMRGWASYFLLYRVILVGADYVFAQSEQMRRDLIARGGNPAKITPVPMGFSAPDVIRKSSNRMVSGPFTVGYLGALESSRRLETLVEALTIVRDNGLDAQLLFVGGSQTAGALAAIEAAAQAWGVARYVNITGLLPRNEALERIREADICMSPFFPVSFLLSTSPTKLVEYLALGLPVVANHHPEQRLVLKQSRAGVCCPWGARHFARSILWLASRTPQERAEMGRRGREWVIQNRTYERIGDDLEKIYLRLLKGYDG